MKIGVPLSGPKDDAKAEQSVTYIAEYRAKVVFVSRVNAVGYSAVEPWSTRVSALSEMSVIATQWPHLPRCIYFWDIHMNKLIRVFDGRAFIARGVAKIADGAINRSVGIGPKGSSWATTSNKRLAIKHRFTVVPAEVAANWSYIVGHL